MIIDKPLLGEDLYLDPEGARGLVGCWLMNERSGGKVFDLSGNGNHLINTGNPVWVSGKYVPALDYDGSSNYSEKTSPVGMNSWPMTIILFGQRETDTTHSPLIALGKSATDADQMWVSVYNGTPQGTIYTGSVNSTIGTSSIAVGEKVHLAFVMASATDRKLYVNGVLEAIDTDSDAFPSVVSYVGIGTLSTASRGYYAGINEFASIYNRALTAFEIARLYREPFWMFERDAIELWAAAQAAPPAGIPIFRRRRAG